MEDLRILRDTGITRRDTRALPGSQDCVETLLLVIIYRRANIANKKTAKFFRGLSGRKGTRKFDFFSGFRTRVPFRNLTFATKCVTIASHEMSPRPRHCDRGLTNARALEMQMTREEKTSYTIRHS